MTEKTNSALKLKSLLKGELKSLNYEFENYDFKYKYRNYYWGTNCSLPAEFVNEQMILDNFEGKGEKNTQDNMIIDGGVKLTISNKTYFSNKSMILNQHTIVVPIFIEETIYLLLFTGFNYKITAVINIQNNNYVDVIHDKNNKPPVHNKLFREKFNHLFYSHIQDFKFELVKYFREANKGLGLIVGAAHLGHSLWNDISGLERGYQKGLLKRVKAVVVLKGSDPFELVPYEFGLNCKLGIVRKSNVQWYEQVANFYYNNFFWLRLTDNLIYSSLSKRLLTKNKKRKGFRITFGLRLENRTWVNQLQGWKDIITLLSEKKNFITVYIDGHNSSSSNEILKSSGESDNDEILQKELNIYQELKEMAPSNVEVVSCIGLTLRENIKLIADSNFFIAPWGAGLAKYSWACGLDGIVMTNLWNLKYREDLHIYNSSNYLEKVPNLKFLESKYISQSDGEVNQLIKSDLAQKENFHVNMEGLLKLVNIELEQI
ncbi:hypothetical protein PH505_cr00130 [Pseudoalteromonas distincta]|uniref:glycosyltransferase 61 family protein n=1 Tax=Pseudoalteromonas distincta TaxID=77608 RepID=UPI00020A0D33|nr:glycosyltransferase 61 family protein [Pseudoalteromonas distincta]EGI71685.1 hypothetical protein PH505_cr00130 [Pseudoalteromonas distincta]